MSGNNARKPCWILCSPRTGSSFLCEIFNQSSLFLPFNCKEITNKYNKLLKKEDSFNEWCRLYNNYYEFLDNPPVHSKMIFHQFFEVLQNIPCEQRHKPGFYSDEYDNELVKNIFNKYNSEYIKKTIFPDIKYILLKRDALSQAASLYAARITKKYHIYDENSLSQYINTKIELINNKLIKCYKDSLFYNEIWDYFLLNDKNLITIEYFDLINDTNKTLRIIFDYLEIDANIDNIIYNFNKKSRIYRMTRSDSVYLEKKITSLLKNKF